MNNPFPLFFLKYSFFVFLPVQSGSNTSLHIPNMKVEGMIYYETPAATVVEVKTEGVVCQSPVKGGNSINDWGNGGTTQEDIYF